MLVDSKDVAWVEKIWRPRTEGKEYFIVIDSPAMVADAWAAGLWAERRPTTPVSAIKNLLSVLIKRY